MMNLTFNTAKYAPGLTAYTFQGMLKTEDGEKSYPVIDLVEGDNEITDLQHKALQGRSDYSQFVSDGIFSVAANPKVVVDTEETKVVAVTEETKAVTPTMSKVATTKAT